MSNTTQIIQRILSFVFFLWSLHLTVRCFSTLTVRCNSALPVHSLVFGEVVHRRPVQAFSDRSVRCNRLKPSFSTFLTVVSRVRFKTWKLQKSSRLGRGLAKGLLKHKEDQDCKKIGANGVHRCGSYSDAKMCMRWLKKAEERKKDNKALFIIHQCVDDAHVEKFQHVKTTREGEKIKKVKLQTLRKHELMQMMEGDRVREYFDKVIAITNQMKGCGEVITDLMVIEKITRSLPQKFDYIVVAREESRELDKMKIEELNLIRSDEKALKVHHSKNEEKKTFKKWKGKRGKGKLRRMANQIRTSARKTKGMLNFSNCHKYEHYSYECYAEKEEQKKEFDTEPLTLMVTTSEENSRSQDQMQYLDSGCSNHMTCHKKRLMNFDETKKSSVKCADDGILKMQSPEYWPVDSKGL
ncbi:hypothetical protein V8G54_001134 [Vigna mungo]|uniref:Retrovirus-related Pol polyprotein from transposon TNT 1-94-like beta-barrel domain-containing protein n=1 Tax=Vigna mungo TaxID=3915 RepID=A0AAQ3P6K2_VIGMU